jgi:hypothetical protein
MLMILNVIRSFPRKRESRTGGSNKDWVPAFAGTSEMSLRMCHAPHC